MFLFILIHSAEIYHKTLLKGPDFPTFRQPFFVSPNLACLFKCLPSSPTFVAQMVKNLLAGQETQVPFLGWEDPLKTEMAIHPSIIAWRCLRTEGDWVFWVTKSWTHLSI